MLNLIGLVIGNELARRRDVPKAERAPFALLGAAALSPVMGAVLVEAALKQRSSVDPGDKGRDTGGDGHTPPEAPRTQAPRKAPAGKTG